MRQLPDTSRDLTGKLIRLKLQVLQIGQIPDLRRDGARELVVVQAEALKVL